MSIRLFAPAAVVLSLLAACGGGSSGGGNSGAGNPPPASTNEPPKFTSADATSTAENGKFSYTAKATDPEGKTVTLEMLTTADSQHFQFANDRLAFRLPPNFEDPLDENRDNIYELTIEASDGEKRSTLNLKVKVTDEADKIRLTRMATDFGNVTSISAIPGSDDLLVAQKDGRVSRFTPSSGMRSLLFAVDPARMNPDVGLLAASPAPGFSKTAHYFVAFLHTDGRLWLESWKPGGPALYTPDLSPLHAKAISSPDKLTASAALGGDDELYVFMGDATKRFDNIWRIARNPSPNSGTNSAPYIPSPKNPDSEFPFDTGYALRQPAGITFYKDDLYFVDRGAWAPNDSDIAFKTGDEINMLKKDQYSTSQWFDFGWPDPAGSTDYPVAYVPDSMPGRPTKTVLGGIVYSGTQSKLARHYIMADSANGNIWSIPIGSMSPGQNWEPAENLLSRTNDLSPDIGTVGGIRAFGKDRSGVSYLADSNGAIYRIDD